MHSSEQTVETWFKINTTQCLIGLLLFESSWWTAFMTEFSNVIKGFFDGSQFLCIKGCETVYQWSRHFDRTMYKTGCQWDDVQSEESWEVSNHSCNGFSLPPDYTFFVEESGNWWEGAGSSKTSSSILSSMGFILLDDLVSRDFSRGANKKTDKFRKECLECKLFMHSRLKEIPNPDSWKRRSSTVGEYREMLQ